MASNVKKHCGESTTLMSQCLRLKRTGGETGNIIDDPPGRQGATTHGQFTVCLIGSVKQALSHLYTNREEFPEELTYFGQSRHCQPKEGPFCSGTEQGVKNYNCFPNKSHSDFSFWIVIKCSWNSIVKHVISKLHASKCMMGTKLWSWLNLHWLWVPGSELWWKREGEHTKPFKSDPKGCGYQCTAPPLQGCLRVLSGCGRLLVTSVVLLLLTEFSKDNPNLCYPQSSPQKTVAVTNPTF